MKINSINLCCLILIFCLSFNDVVKGNKKLQRIILASLISKTLKSHMGGSHIVPIQMPQFKTFDKHIDNHAIVGHTNPIIPQQHVQHTPTITVHHYHHHTTSHHLDDSIYSNKYDETSSYDNYIEPLLHQTDHYDTYDNHNLGSKHISIGSNLAGSNFNGGGNGILGGTIQGNVGNILGGSISGGIGR